MPRPVLFTASKNTCAPGARVNGTVFHTSVLCTRSALQARFGMAGHGVPPQACLWTAVQRDDELTGLEVGLRGACNRHRGRKIVAVEEPIERVRSDGGVPVRTAMAGSRVALFAQDCPVVLRRGRKPCGRQRWFDEDSGCSSRNRRTNITVA